MDILRTGRNPWDQEILIGIAWDLVWLAVVASALFVVGHIAFMVVRGRKEEAATAASEDGGRVPRHSLAARAFHWTMALAMLVLLVTAFVPVLGLQFPWLTLHWIAGVALTASIVFHVVHVFGWQDFWAMWVKPSEVGHGIEELKHAFGAGSGEVPKAPGKYAFDHKLYHHMAAVTGLTAIVTGLLMMVRIDTPLVARNPYLLSDAAWGVVYVLHGLSGVALIGLVTAHIYFALRPEKRWMTWAMVRGWITRGQYVTHYDTSRWRREEDEAARSGSGAVADAAAQAPREDA